jgi:hypothetical protein
MDKEAATALASYDHWFRYCMPWKFVRLGTGEEHVYLPVNRGLKPLGVTGQGCVRWHDCAAQAVVFRSDPHGFEGVWIDPVGTTPGLFLYDDTPECQC